MITSADSMRAAVTQAQRERRQGTELERAPSKLEQRYLIALNIPVFSWNGGMYTDRLWLLDLHRHLDYIESPVLFCPLIAAAPPAGCELIPREAPFDRLRIVGVPPANSLVSALLLAPLHMVRAWTAVKQADIVHGGGIGWPIPMGYYCAVAARLQRKFHISIMESSPWRALPNESPALSKRIRAGIMERMASWIARHSDLALFTTVAYRDSMVGPDAPNGHVFKASWILEQQLSPTSDVERCWSSRPPGAALKIGFVARLTVEKGTRVLLACLRHLDPERQFEVFVLGEGACSAEVLATRAPANVTVRALGTVEYGQAFFRLLDAWDVIVVPSLSDEQPRIVYDAFARGRPVVGSRTSALAECISDGKDGLLFPTGDAAALAERLNYLAANDSALAHMALNARRSAEQHTHVKMHAERRVLIEAAWASRRRRSVSRAQP